MSSTQTAPNLASFRNFLSTMIAGVGAGNFRNCHDNYAYQVLKAEAVSAVAMEGRELLRNASFVPFLSGSTKSAFNRKIDQGHYDALSRSGGYNSIVLGSPQAKELIGYVLKAFYNAHPFVKKREVVINVRSCTLDIQMKSPRDVFGERNSLALVTLFDQQSSYFRASTQFVPTAGASDTATLEPTTAVISLSCATMARYAQVTRAGENWPRFRQTPVFRAAMLLDKGATIAMAVNRSSNRGHLSQVVLDRHYVDDLNLVFQFLRSNLEHMKCTTISS